MNQFNEMKKRGYVRTSGFEKEHKQSKEGVILKEANQVITVTKPFSGSTAFEISNEAYSDLSSNATINIEISVSGKNWELATDANGDNITYTLTSGSSIVLSISGIPEALNLRVVVVEDLTGTLDVYTIQ